MIYVLLVGLILQLVYCYFVFRKDLFSPSAILCEVFIMSVLACIYNISGSNYDIQPITAWIILGGNTIFILVSTIVHLFFKKRNTTKKDQQPEKLKYINITNTTTILTVVLYLMFAIVFIVMSMSVIKNVSTGGDFSSTMSAYRDETLDEGSSLPGWLTKTRVIFDIGSFVLMYIFINNVITDKKNKSNYWLLFCVILYLATSVLTAQRTTILIMFLYSLFVTYNLLNRKYQFTKKINSKYIRRGIIVVLAFLALFGLTRGLFGRTDGREVVDSVTYYMGNSIEFMDSYIKKPVEKKQFGEELFWRFRTVLSKYGLAEEPIGDHYLEFRQATRGNFGNVYPGYRYYIHDFGYVSMIPFTAFVALFFGIWYEKLNKRKLRDNIDLSFIFFSWFVATVLFRFSLMESFFTALAYFIFTHWYVFFIWKIFFNFKFIARKITVNAKNN